MSDTSVKVLVFSDDSHKRRAVMNGIGLRASKDTPRIEWVEAATAFGVRDAVDAQDFAALILDAEAKKEGGMSVAQDLRETRDDVPPVIFLTARVQDDWLATWPALRPRSPTRWIRSFFRKPSPTCSREPTDERTPVGSHHRVRVARAGPRLRPVLLAHGPGDERRTR